MQVNDPEALELAFHQGPTFIKAYCQLYTFELFPSQIAHFIHVVPCKLYTLKGFSCQIVHLILETGNDPEALELAFHQGPTIINAYFQAATNLVDRDSGMSNDLPRPRRSELSECFV